MLNRCHGYQSQCNDVVLLNLLVFGISAVVTLPFMLERIKISKLRISQNINIHKTNVQSFFFFNMSNSLRDMARFEGRVVVGVN